VAAASVRFALRKWTEFNGRFCRTIPGTCSDMHTSRTRGCVYVFQPSRATSVRAHVNVVVEDAVVVAIEPSTTKTT
jgi:hypothetical protein